MTLQILHNLPDVCTKNHLFLLLFNWYKLPSIISLHPDYFQQHLFDNKAAQLFADNFSIVACTLILSTLQVYNPPPPG